MKKTKASSNFGRLMMIDFFGKKIAKIMEKCAL